MQKIGRERIHPPTPTSSQAFLVNTFQNDFYGSAFAGYFMSCLQVKIST